MRPVAGTGRRAAGRSRRSCDSIRCAGGGTDRSGTCRKEEVTVAEELLLKDVQAPGGARADLLIRDGQIAEVGPGLAAMTPGATVINAGGRLLFPGFVDAHAHIDKTLI